MKNIFKHATLCTIVACIFFTTLCCMDERDIGLFPDDGQMVFSLLKFRLDYFDHHTLCALAINKEWKNLLLDTAPARKKEFFKLQKHFDPFVLDSFVLFVYQTSWHKYGSAFGRRRESHDYDADPTWILQGGYLRGNGLIPHNYERIKMAGRTVSFVDPKFNERGDFVYFGVGYDCNSHTIIEHGYPESIASRLLLEKDDFCESIVEMVPFTAFSNLLKAFLNNLEMHVNGTFKFCDLQKVIIPNNYKECTPNDEYKSYNDLPEWWREVIDKRYLEQKK